jgi:hypothetical protein
MVGNELETRIFTYEEALESFPEVRRLTEAAVGGIEAMVNALKSREEMEARKAEMEAACRGVVDEWMSQIRALGCETKGLWLVDWDCGVGYYCWRYPEASLGHFHGYDEGFAGRVPIN